MADYLITAVSARYTGTDQGDSFRNGTGNLRSITVAGLSGDDILTLGSAVTTGTGAGGQGLGFSLASSDIDLGAGSDTYTFSGQAGSGFAQSNSNTISMGDGDDFVLINGLASASASTVRAGSGNDELGFVNGANANTAFNVLINGNAGNDSITATWAATGGEVKNFLVEGGQGNDTFSALFSQVSAYAGAASGSNASGVRVQGNKGDDLLEVDVFAAGGVGGTSTDVVVNGNSGADTINFTALITLSNSQILGGRDNDSISASLQGITAQNVIVGGGHGNDTANLSLSGAVDISAVQLQGNSGNDSLSFSLGSAAITGGYAVTAFQDNGIFGGTGTDTINLNLGGSATLQGTGASAFVADLGLEGSGGIINVGVESGAVLAGTGIFFRGSTAADTINLSSDGTISGTIISGEAGADSITYLGSNTAATLLATRIFGGDGNDLMRLQGATAGITGWAASGNGILLDGGTGADVLGVVLSGNNSEMTGGTIQGGLGNDTITATLAQGSRLRSNGATAGVQQLFDGGSGADSITFTLASGAVVGNRVQLGSGADVFIATVASGGSLAGITAQGGAGDDTIAVTFSAARTGGITLAGGLDAFFEGNDGADSITLLASLVTGGRANVGNARGGAGNDVLTLGTNNNVTGETTNIIGSFNGGAGADSIIFSGNNTVSGAIARFLGNTATNTGGFIFASGDSLVGGFDTIIVSNNDVTGGQANLAGTFGSAGFLFTGFNDPNAGAFNMAIGATDTTAGRVSAGDAIFRRLTVGGSELTTRLAIVGGGVIGGYTAGGTVSVNGGSRAGTYVLSGGSTLGQIFSSVDALGAGAAGLSVVFNVQNGSAGSIDGYLFVQGGVLTDTIIKLEGNGLAAGALAQGDLYFSAGRANGLGIARAASNSAGQLKFGANVGVG